MPHTTRRPGTPVATLAGVAGPAKSKDHAACVRIGTSGWNYPHWCGTFYPEGLAVRRQLRYLATRFPTVEINGSFYSLLRPSGVERWRTEVPPSFIFAVKGSRFISHMKKLGGGIEVPLANFFASGILLLGAQLGPILWQLPPLFAFREDRVRAFLERLPRDMREAERLAARHDARVEGPAAVRAPDGRDARLRYAFEVRDKSWVSGEALGLLARFDVALVAADTAGRWPLLFERTARDFRYARLHGSERLYASCYTDAELAEWAARVRGWAAEGNDVYVYFDNDAHAHAPHDALRLVEALERAPAPAPPGGRVAGDGCVPQARRPR